MSESNIPLLGAVALLAVLLMVFMHPAEAPHGAEIANPASLKCIEDGGTLEMRETRTGTKGFCMFPDKSECEEWSYFNGGCYPGQRKCKDLCGNGICEEIVCMAVGCPCAETADTCFEDCA